MKKIYLVLLILLLARNSIFLEAKSEDTENILQKTTKTVLENKPEKKEEVVEIGQILFKVKRTDLWLKDKSDDKKKLDEFAEIVLPGKLYNPPKDVSSVEKKDVDRSTIEGIVASVFSANKSGNLNWIADNFTDSDKEKIKTLFKNKKLLEESKSDAEKIFSVYLIGQANYKDSVLVFIQQDYLDGRKVKESLACKQTENGWKVTNEFANDANFDIIFSALSSGEFAIKGKELLKKEKSKDSKS